MFIILFGLLLVCPDMGKLNLFLAFIPFFPHHGDQAVDENSLGSSIYGALCSGSCVRAFFLQELRLWSCRHGPQQV